jgi:hypothetical protein
LSRSIKFLKNWNTRHPLLYQVEGQDAVSNKVAPDMLAWQKPCQQCARLRKIPGVVRLLLAAFIGIASVLLSEGAGTIHAQEPVLRFERLTVEDGMASGKIYSIYQDRYGFMWFGTNQGLSKYDSYTFTNYRYDPDDPASLSDNTVFVVYEDTSGTLWAGTRNGLNRFNRDTETFTHYWHDPDHPSSLLAISSKIQPARSGSAPSTGGSTASIHSRKPSHTMRLRIR